MKRLLIALLLAVLAAPAFAVLGTVDDVPAATLLLPYFEVDLDDANGVNTLMSINNASATATLVHVVLWTDLSVHILDFNIYLTGYDVQTLSLRDILVEGNLPITGYDVSPFGPASPIPGADFPGCSTLLPYSNPALNDTYVDFVQNALTGQSNDVFGWDGDCGGIDHEDNIARGYVTADVVHECSLDYPESTSYFEGDPGGIEGPGRIAANDNVIWGDYFYVNPAENFAQGETLVHVEAASGTPWLDDDTYYTFYYRYSANDLFSCPGCDNREALGNIFAVRYVDGGGFTGGTDLLVWRDSKHYVSQGPYCGGYPSPFPLGQHQVVVFDEEENFEVPEGCTISPCEPGEETTPFPWETQRTEVGSPALPSSYDFGWIYLNLNFDTNANYAAGFNWDPLMQNWVTAVMDAEGRFSVGFDAIQLSNVTGGIGSFISVIPGPLDDCIYTLDEGGPVLPCEDVEARPGAAARSGVSH